MSENQRDSRTLRVLLLMCAGLLLVMVVILVSAMGDARTSQSAYATQQASGACGMAAQEFRALPQALQPQLKENCALLAEPEVR